MQTHLFLLTFSMIMLVSGCQKDKTDESDGGITTLELQYEPSAAVYGNDYTFRVKLKSASGVVEYGIVYLAWKDNYQDPTPKLNATGSEKIVFPGPPQSGTTQTFQKTLAYVDFNDANYRAYAILDDGSIIYGEIRYIVFS